MLANAEAEPTSLAGWLVRRALSSPGEPWLFERDVLDWRWCSWAQVADQAARAQALWRDGAPGDSVTLTRDLQADSVAADLGAQAAGLRVRMAERSVAGSSSANPAHPLPPIQGRPVRSVEPLAVASSALGGAWVTSFDGERDVLFSGQEMLDAASLVASRLPTLPRPTVVLIAGSLADVTVRAALAWTLRAGVATALEPDPEAVAEAALWVRPHVLVAPPGGLAAAASALRAQPKRWRRLRAVVVTSSPSADAVSSSADTVSAAEDTAWQRLCGRSPVVLAPDLWTRIKAAGALPS